MSAIHPPREWSGSEVLAATNRDVPSWINTAVKVLFGVGLVVFVVGLFMAPDRAWRAWHANWLFFAGLTSAGMAIVAVQRITTARWSRHVIRFMEAYVAFMPVAFLFLLITFIGGKNYVFPWTHEAYPGPEKALYFNPGFLISRDLVIFAIMTLLGLWYIYTAVCVDVGRVP